MGARARGEPLATKAVLRAGAIFIALMGLTEHTAYGECFALTKGPVVVDVNSCEPTRPEARFLSGNKKYKWVQDLDRPGRAQLFQSYRGSLLSVTVAHSEAIRKGLSEEKGALKGERIRVFVQGAASCSTLSKRRFQAQLQEICCGGSGKAPCLLGTSYRAQLSKDLGSKGAGGGQKARRQAAQSKEYQEGLRLYRQKKFYRSAKSFAAARKSGQTDIRGLYLEGLANRRSDRCKQAIAPLQQINQQYNKGRVWSEDQATARKGIFLLARCHAKIGEAGAATLILSSFLHDPAKYQEEIRSSLTHPDFGWIRTSKEYQDYQKSARKAQRRVPSDDPF